MKIGTNTKFFTLRAIMNDVLLEIHELILEVNNGNGSHRILDHLDMSIGKGKVVSIIGPSGSGKSMLARSIMQLHDDEKMNVQGHMIWCQKDQCTDLMRLSPSEINQYRGKEIGWILQQPWHAFNPTVSCGDQVAESLILHRSLSRSEAKDQIIQLMQSLSMDNAARLYDLYPHQLSGGQLQRMALAAVLIHKPKLIIADEATVSLDRETEKSIVNILQDHVIAQGTSLLWISHDLPLSFTISDYIYCLDQGKIVDHGNPASIRKSQHSLTLSLLHTNYEKQFVASPEDKKLIELRNINKQYGSQTILKEFDMVIHKRERLGLTGHSGSGKSTLARIIAGIDSADNGQVIMHEKIQHNAIQMVFQQPSLSFNPRCSLFQSMKEALQLSGANIALMNEALHGVNIKSELLSSYPHQLSGGQLQRLSIARAMLFKPSLLIMDEAVTALDTVHKKQILDLLDELYLRYPMSYLFISHDIELTTKFCSRTIHF